MTADKADLSDWLEQLVLTQGPRAGERMRLMGWQRDFIQCLMAEDVFTAALSTARGNGKSAFVGGLAAAAVHGPLAVPGSDVVIVAGSLSQARVAYGHAKRFLEPLMEGGRRVWRQTDSPTGCEIRNLETGIRLVAKSSDPKNAHGLAPSLVLCDEPAQWKTGRSEAMLAAMETSVGKIGCEKVIALGTRSADPGHWFEEWLQGQCDFSLLYAYDGGSESMFSDDALQAANPSLLEMPGLRAAIDGQIARIQQSSSPRDIAAYRALRLNAGTSETYRMALVEADEWLACERDDADGNRYGPCVWGVDLGSSAAMSAIAAYWPATGWLEVVAALPAEPSLARRGDMDGVGPLYQRMADRGELLVCGGRTVDIPALLAASLRRFGPPVSVAGDRWRESELLDGLQLAGIPPANWSPRGQGFKDASEDIRYFERAVADGQVLTPRSLLLRAAVGGCVLVQDPAGNRKIAKGSMGFRVAKHRDDAAVAAVAAVAEGRRGWDVQANGGSVVVSRDGVSGADTGATVPYQFF